MSIFLFDFDGVIVDSIREVACSAYFGLTGKVAFSEEELPAGYLGHFLKHASLFHRAGDALPLSRWCLENPMRELSRVELEIVLVREKSTPKERADELFAARSKMMKQEMKRWCALHCLFEPFSVTFHTLLDAPPIIITNKNRAAVIELCRHFQIPISEERLFSGELGKKKDENFKIIMEKFPAKHYFLIDDSFDNLITLNQKFPELITPILPLWGYFEKEEQEKSLELSFKIFNQQETLDFIKETLLR
jgi:beta-phosphoglucomutase-like phosphatase (HAD superfamily)